VHLVLLSFPRNWLRMIFVAMVMSLQGLTATAQDISFFHLNTSNGLSENLVSAVARDKDGILWIGTAEGLNSYDGYTVKKYFKEDEPALVSNNISGLLVDDQNRIWIRNFSNKITLVDEKRRFYTVPVMENGKEVPAFMLCKTRSRGVLVFSGNKIYSLSNEKPYTFQKLNWKEDTALFRGYPQPLSGNTDTILLVGNDRLCVFDIANLRILHSVEVPEIIGAAWLNSKEIIVTTQLDRQLLKVDLVQQKVIYNYAMDIRDQYGEPVKGYLRYIRKLNDGRFIISSGYGGVYIFDAVNVRITRYMHDPLNSRSIAANNTFYVFGEDNGYVYITTRTAGLSYFNSNFRLAAYRSSFQSTENGEIFHGFVNAITREPGGNYWLGTQKGLIEWDKRNNKVRFHDYGMVDGKPLRDIEEVRALCFDRLGRLWVGTNRYGIIVLDRNRKPIKYFSTRATNETERIPGNWLNSFTLSKNDRLWAATSAGLAIINTQTLQVEKIDALSALKPLEKTHCYSVWLKDSSEWWIASSKGAYRYWPKTNQLYIFNTSKGLPTDIIFGFINDNNGTIYAASHKGLHLFKGDSVVKSYLKNKGLVNDRCYGLIRDEQGHIWIGNDNALLRYDPVDSNFTVYDESYGLSPSGYRALSFYQDNTEEQFWGSDAGLSYFFPGQLKTIQRPLSVAITSVQSAGKNYNSTEVQEIKLPHARNHLLFYFTAIDLYRSKNLFYEYKLEGADADWVRTLSPQQVSYGQLGPGTYTFRVRVSREGKNWLEASNPVTVVIMSPWWRSAWFIGLLVGLGAGTFFFAWQRRSKRIRQQQEQLEVEQAISYFATSITGQGSVEDTLWAVVKNCISRLGFEDCVIYMLDEQRQVLVQKAAWGPKTTEENKILNPIEIPVGKGIVGTVALSGKAEIIGDTAKDERYIVDDKRRYSEITVPILSDNKVIGVIDSEHSKKNFFTRHHLSILTTIASLCASKIIRKRAEEEKIKAEKNLLITERQSAEMEMQALRAQMNPHFLFNSLNSINNFILKNDPDNASQYLTRFSRLMRLILDNSREEWVPLENEIKALQLYIEMEAIRFDNVFEYTIQITPDIDPLTVMVPPMLVQPYVENAIWHGLLHRKVAGSKLDISIRKEADELSIQVVDNGVGREEAENQKSRFSSHKKSHGMLITSKRLDIVNRIYKAGASVEITDLVDAEGKPAGTAVSLKLKYKMGSEV
jgi:ligand-binding sensor domain-containing protein/putative methionine-R-sulfoxide reductase with GAF domain